MYIFLLNYAIKSDIMELNTTMIIEREMHKNRNIDVFDFIFSFVILSYR